MSVNAAPHVRRRHPVSSYVIRHHSVSVVGSLYNTSSRTVGRHHPSSYTVARHHQPSSPWHVIINRHHRGTSSSTVITVARHHPSAYIHCDTSPDDMNVITFPSLSVLTRNYARSEACFVKRILQLASTFTCIYEHLSEPNAIFFRFPL